MSFGSKTLILFDGECLLCNDWVKLLRRIDSGFRLDFSHIGSSHAQSIITKYHLQDIDSLIVLANDKVLLRSRAVLAIIRELKLPYSWLYIGVIIPNFIRDWLYRMIARNRLKWFDRSPELTCELLVGGNNNKKD